MDLRKKWKNFGKTTGQAFANFGKSMATTAKIVVGSEDSVDENGNSKLKQSWSKTGKGFGAAGKSLGEAAESTVERVDEELSDENASQPNQKAEDNVIDV